MTQIHDSLSLAGRTVLVTGASSGLGKHFAKVVCAAGASVVIGARRTDRLEALAKQLEAGGGQVLPVAMDVTQRDSVEAAFTAAERELGLVDIVINNAGIGGPENPLETSEESWRTMIATNLDGVWRVAQCASQRLVKARQPGSIVNIASILGLRVAKGLSHYSAAKAGVVQLTKSLALELARYDIRVNALAPGYFKTEMNSDFFETEKAQAYLRKNVPMGRLGELDELSAPLLLLASQAGRFITGAVIPVDGGHMVSAL